MKKIAVAIFLPWLLGFAVGFAHAGSALTYYTSSATAVDMSVIMSTTSGNQSITLQDGTPIFGNFGRVLIGTSTIIGSSNAGIQYSNAGTNRGQIRMNQFGPTGVGGLTAFRSRGVDISSLSPVNVNDELLRLNAIAVAPNSNIPIVGSFIIRAATSPHITSPGYVPTVADLLLVNYTAAATYSAWSVDPNGNMTAFGNVISSGKNLTTTFVSSATAGGGSTITNTVATTCISGSTLTFTTAGSQRARVSMQGSVESTNVAEVNFAFLIDGAYVDNFNDTNHISSNEGNANNEQTVSWSYTTQPLSDGTHTVCFIIRSSAGVQTIPVGDIVQYSIETRP